MARGVDSLAIFANILLTPTENNMSITTKYRLEYKEVVLASGRRESHEMSWPNSQPTTEKALQGWIQMYEVSTVEGGCNSHIGPRSVTLATLVNQKTGAKVRSFAPPMFWVR